MILFNKLKDRKLLAGEFYHIYNRGFLKMRIFKSDRDCRQFLSKMESYSKKFGIKIFNYALMDNHFHFLLRQDYDGSLINKFLQKLQQSYATYFNIKYKRKGPVFEGRFKFARVDKEEYFWILRGYIANNPIKAAQIMPNGTNVNSSKVMLEQ